MSLQGQIDAIAEMATGHGSTIIAQSAAIRLLCRLMKNVIGDDYDTEVESMLAIYDEALKDGPLKDAAMEELRGLLVNE